MIEKTRKDLEERLNFAKRMVKQCEEEQDFPGAEYWLTEAETILRFLNSNPLLA